jgi:hypothetical protein
VVTNNGTMAHALAVRGPGVNLRLPGVLQPGQTSVLRVPGMQPGAYQVYCPVDNHAGMGMTTTFTVLAAGALPPAVVGQGSPPPETLPPSNQPQDTEPIPEG